MLACRRYDTSFHSESGNVIQHLLPLLEEWKMTGGNEMTVAKLFSLLLRIYISPFISTRAVFSHSEYISGESDRAAGVAYYPADLDHQAHI